MERPPKKLDALLVVLEPEALFLWCPRGKFLDEGYKALLRLIQRQNKEKRC